MFGATLSAATSRDVFSSRLPRLASLALLSVVFAFLSALTASAQYCTPDQCDECNLRRCSQRCCHQLPELWLINTRRAPRCKNLDNGYHCLTYKRYDRRCCRWIRESEASFLAQESSLPTLFYSHGNSLNHKNAMKACWKVYCKMRCCPGPKRLVFWSWPAERVYKTEGFRVREMIAKNLRIKYVYAEYQGYYMAKLVNQMSLSQRVMMSGHSYGAITAAAALHYIGGGCLRGLTLAGGAAVERPNLRAGIISGAFDNDMLIPGHRYGQAFVAGEKIFVTRNIKDSTLKKWPKTSWTGRLAIGVTGVNANCLGVYRSKLCQQTSTPDVGKSHYLNPHLKSARFVSALCCLSFPACQSQPLAAASEYGEPEPIAEVMPEAMFDEPVAGEAEFVAESATESGAEPWVAEPVPAESELDAELSEYAADLVNIPLWESEQASPPNWVETDRSEVYGDEATIDSITAEERPLTAKSAAVDLTNFAMTRQAQAMTGAAQESRQRQFEQFQSQQNRLQQLQARQVVSSHPVSKPPADVSCGQYSSWYHGGLCLALVLTGPLYVVFGKRVSAS